jgi:hypothetical protein
MLAGTAAGSSCFSTNHEVASRPPGFHASYRLPRESLTVTTVAAEVVTAGQRALTHREEANVIQARVSGKGFTYPPPVPADIDTSLADNTLVALDFLSQLLKVVKGRLRDHFVLLPWEG